MDTDDLTDDAYAIITDARRLNGLLGAELAVAGKNAGSEAEFLHCMLTILSEVRNNIEDYIEDAHDETLYQRQLAHAITRLQVSIQSLLARGGSL